jgi:hypothetical protein
MAKVSRRKIGIAGGLVAVVGVVVGLLATNAPAITTAQEFRLVARELESKSLDFGGQGPSLGDEIIFSGELRKPGTHRLAGRFDGVCTFTSRGVGGSSEHRQQCVVTTTIGSENGETEIEAQGVGRIEAEDFFVAVTGGTQEYQNARGQIFVRFRPDGTARLLFNLIP